MKKLLTRASLLTLTLTNPLLASAGVTVSDFREMPSQVQQAYVSGLMEALVYVTADTATWKRICLEDLDAQVVVKDRLADASHPAAPPALNSPMYRYAATVAHTTCRARRARHYP